MTLESAIRHNRGMDLASHYRDDIIVQFQKQKELADKAISQVSDDELFRTLDAESNSIATLMRHIGGNLRSRFTDFLTSDGEKPDRHRDGEFEMPANVTRPLVSQEWEKGFATLFDALNALTPSDLERAVSIRGERMSVVQALNRAITHLASHVGQMVWLAKHLRGAGWKTLSIPRGQSEQFNARRQS
jgi:hypothetical protein